MDTGQPAIWFYHYEIRQSAAHIWSANMFEQSILAHVSDAAIDFSSRRIERTRTNSWRPEFFSSLLLAPVIWNLNEISSCLFLLFARLEERIAPSNCANHFNLPRGGPHSESLSITCNSGSRANIYIASINFHHPSEQVVKSERASEWVSN